MFLLFNLKLFTGMYIVFVLRLTFATARELQINILEGKKFL